MSFAAARPISYCPRGRERRARATIRLDAKVKQRLDALAERSNRSKSFLAAEAIAAYVASEEWQLGEIHAGLKDLNEGKSAGHEAVSKWLRSWGKRAEGQVPR